MFTAYVILTLTVWDVDTGRQLYITERPMWHREMGEDLIEKCRMLGVARAYELTEWFRGYGTPNVTTNVDCEWHKGNPT